MRQGASVGVVGGETAAGALVDGFVMGAAVGDLVGNLVVFGTVVVSGETVGALVAGTLVVRATVGDLVILGGVDGDNVGANDVVLDEKILSVEERLSPPSKEKG